MNKFLFLFLFLFLFFLFPVNSYSQTPELEKKQQELKESKVKIYREILSTLENNVDNFCNIHLYKNKVFKNQDINNLDKNDPDQLNLFLIYQAQSISDIMYMIHATWLKEISRIKDKKELEALLVSLQDLRKKHAVKFENLLEQNLEKVNKASKEEKTSFIIKIKKWHDEQNLIDRNTNYDKVSNQRKSLFEIQGVSRY